MRCPYCGQPNSENAHNCRRCGKRIDSVRERKKERHILARGILLIALILIAGIAAMVGLMKVLPKETTEPKDNKVVINTTTAPTPTATPAETEKEEEPVAEEPKEQPPIGVSAGLISADQFAVISEAYRPVVVSGSEASSIILQDGMDNGPQMLYDGQDWSSWQEGVDGPGIGENVRFTLDREYQIRGFAVRLGNWYEPEDYYYMNNRPETMTFTVGNEQFSLTFPDQMVEMYIELNRDVPASQVSFTIDSVYPGTYFDDTCINEITIYGM